MKPPHQGHAQQHLPAHLTPIAKKTHRLVARHLFKSKELRKKHNNNKKLIRDEVKMQIFEYQREIEQKCAINFDNFLRVFTSFPPKKKIVLAMTLTTIFQNKHQQLNVIKNKTIQDIIRITQLEAKLAELKKFESHLREYSQIESIAELKARLKKQGIRL